MALKSITRKRIWFARVSLALGGSLAEIASFLQVDQKRLDVALWKTFGDPRP